MRKIGLAIILLLLVSSAVIYRVFLYRGGNPEPDGEHVSLENAIIINGIRMESDQPPMEEEQNASGGSIIYNDSFDDPASKAPERQARKDTFPTAVAKRRPESGINRLKTRDSRWHLVNYRIRKSDNLWSVSRKFGVSHSLVIDLNGIDNPDMLSVGKTIQVPSRNGVYHTVQGGDTLTSIARRYKVTVASIRHQNGVRGSAIMVKARLFIPDAVETVTVPAHEGERIARSSHGQVEKRIARNERKADVGRMNMLWPISGRITSGFGNRVDPFEGRRAFHCGIDISAESGTKVLAASHGTVIFSGWRQGYGKTVILRHPGGYITVYAHNSENKVQENDAVSRGDVIALSGNTGAVTGAHLHFELRKYLTPLNPLRFLRR
jgi:murein DD-endopeptidase MepM/ murein hydrolase activator NlpD